MHGKVTSIAGQDENFRFRSIDGIVTCEDIMSVSGRIECHWRVSISINVITANKSCTNMFNVGNR